VLQHGLLTTGEATLLTARITKPTQAAEVLGALVAENIDVAEFSVGAPSLDEVFLELTGHGATEEMEGAT
jgi:ABC-2 type transport system ATP-binding protein